MTDLSLITKVYNLQYFPKVLFSAGYKFRLQKSFYRLARFTRYLLNTTRQCITEMLNFVSNLILQ